MRIDRLELQNFWGFEKFTLDLHPNATAYPQHTRRS